MRATPSQPREDQAALSDASIDVASLTRRMAAGEDSAYVSFHRLYFERLARYLIVVTRGDEQWMRDALQGTFARIAKHVRVFESEAVFWSWLTRLARTAAIDERRTTRRYWAFLDRLRHQPPPTPPADVPDDPLPGLLESHLEQLDAADRALLEAKYFEHLKTRTLAEQLGTTEAAVESRLVRLRQKLRAAILRDLRR